MVSVLPLYFAFTETKIFATSWRNLSDLSTTSFKFNFGIEISASAYLSFIKPLRITGEFPTDAFISIFAFVLSKFIVPPKLCILIPLYLILLFASFISPFTKKFSLYLMSSISWIFPKIFRFKLARPWSISITGSIFFNSSISVEFWIVSYRFFRFCSLVWTSKSNFPARLHVPSILAGLLLINPFLRLKTAFSSVNFKTASALVRNKFGISRKLVVTL